MSLIITSSQDPRNIPQISISAPYQYRNDFRSGIKIPANSEIAVESVKINRNPALDYEQGQVTLFWFGERLATNASLDEGVSWIIPSINRIDKNLSPSDFKEEFLPMMKMAYSLHPEIDSKNITMTPIHNTTSVIHPFQGYRYNINQIGASATSVVPPSGTEKVIFGGAQYDGTTIDADENDTFVQLQPVDAQGGPISLFDGEIKYNNIVSSGTWTLGLMRPIYNAPTDAEYITSNPTLKHFAQSGTNEGIGPDEDMMFDYAVEAGDDGYARVWQSMPDSESSGKMVMTEVVYYNDTDTSTSASNASNSSFVGTTPIPSASITDITFNVRNEKVIISASGKVIVEAIRTSASFKDQIPKPVNQNCWKMYPTVGLWETGDSVDIATYRCRTNTTMYDNKLANNWSFKSTIHADMNDVFEEAVDDDTGLYVVNTPWRGAGNWPKSLDFRDIMKSLVDYEDEFNPPHTSDATRQRLGLNASTMAQYEPLLIVGKSERYTQDLVQEWTPNSMNVLGFSPFAVAPIEDSVTPAGGQASFTSTTRPSMTSENSTFIRVPTLNHKTLNFGTGNPSKILFQVPRFDNSGAETGALFFQNPDKTYIDLNNPADFTITDLDVHFVRKDETFAKDLTGSSEVVFHIRRKSKL